MRRDGGGVMARSKKDLLASFKAGTDTDALATAAQSDVAFRMLRLADLSPHPDNRPIDRAFVEELAASIESDGLGNPICVRPLPEGGYQVVSGHHRVEAKRLLASRHPDDPRHKVIEAVVREMGDADAEAMLLATNVYVNAISGEERQRSLERLGRAVDKMRADDPARYRGVRSATIIADKVAESGGKVSERTVYRDLAAAKARKEALEAQGDGRAGASRGGSAGRRDRGVEAARRGAARGGRRLCRGRRRVHAPRPCAGGPGRARQGGREDRAPGDQGVEGARGACCGGQPRQGRRRGYRKGRQQRAAGAREELFVTARRSRDALRPSRSAERGGKP